MPIPQSPLVIYVDIDETLIRNYGTKRILMPAVIGHARQLFENRGKSLLLELRRGSIRKVQRRAALDGNL